MRTQENGHGMTPIHVNGRRREGGRFVNLTAWVKRVNGAHHEDSGVVDLTPWLGPETGQVPTTAKGLAGLINRLVVENSQVVEIVEVMNTAIAHAERLEAALAGLLGPEALGGHSDTELSELYGHRGMAAIIAARVVAVRCAENRRAQEQRITNGAGEARAAAS